MLIFRHSFSIPFSTILVPAYARSVSDPPINAIAPPFGFETKLQPKQSS